MVPQRDYVTNEYDHRGYSVQGIGVRELRVGTLHHPKVLENAKCIKYTHNGVSTNTRWPMQSNGSGVGLALYTRRAYFNTTLEYENLCMRVSCVFSRTRDSRSISDGTF